MHRPVAAASAVVHLLPSGAPLAHSRETNASSAPHWIVPVPATTRKAGAEPASPFGPGGPAGPAGPCGPCAPAGPAGPCAPAGPGVGCPHPASVIIIVMAKKLRSRC